MGATGESDRKVADAGYNPAWSPDGQEIVYATKGFLRQEYRTGGGSQLFAVNVSTGDTRLLSKQAPDAVQPSWSPHGQRIAYWAREGARRDIWTMSVQSGEPRRVTDDAFGDWSPTWSPDGRWLYFASDRAGSMNLWRVAIDEPSGKLLGPPEAVPTPSPYSGPISLSKDGKRIAYVQQVSTTSFQKVAFNPVTETTVGPPISVTQLSRELYLPDVTRDNGWLAFSSIGNPEDIFIVRTDGTELSQLTDDATMDRAPVFSPDGTRIAFIRQGTGHGYFEVWVMNRDGSGRRQLTFTSDKVASVPVWSPDGARLAYPFDAPDYPAFIVEVGKGWAEQTPTLLPLMNAADGSRFMIRSWSPDGTRLAGERRLVSAAVGIVTYSFASGTYEQLTESGWYPCWLNDSSRLLFQDEGRIFLVDSRTRKVHEVLSVAPREVSPYRFAISGDNRWIYFGITVTEADVWVVDLH
jgi:Tol biopolymer transport system component